MEFAAGTQVTSAVRLVRPLGRGGMGTVWVAEHTTLMTEVVVKFMSEALACDPISLARFSREASAAAAVKSPHVVQMLDHGFTTDGTPFIVMELLDGEDLKARLARDHVLPLEELEVVVTQACKALGRAHASGIVHRDIKPENIFLCRTDDGEPFVKLLDFGIAKSGSPSDFHMTQTGVTVGTPYYMSPEQAVGAPPVDATTDLWSLGVVTFESMTGTRPFDGPTLGALTIAICNERPPVPSSIDARIPTSVDVWIAKACARDRGERFSTAKAMSDAFVAALRGPLVSRPPLAGAGLAFEATSLGSTPPKSPSNAPAAGVVIARSAESAPATESSPGFSTTSIPFSRTNHPRERAARSAPPAPPTSATSGKHDQWSTRLRVAAGILLLFVVAAAVFARTRPSQDDRSLGAVSIPPPPVQPTPSPSPALPPSAAVRTAPWAVVSPSATATASVLSPGLPGAPAPSASHASSTGAAVVHAPLPAPASAAPSSTAPAATPATCNPPYYFDSAHTKIFKQECL